MIWFGEAKNIPAFLVTAAESVTVIDVPLISVGSGTVELMVVSAARPAPNAAAIDSGASGAEKLAADTLDRRPSCLTGISLSPMVRTPVRTAVVAFEATCSVITLFPVPPDVPRVSHGTLLCAVHAQALEVVSMIPLPPPADLNERSAADSSYEHTAIGRINVLDSPPPGPGVKMVTFAFEAVARSSAAITAERLTLLVTIVARSAPFQRSTDAPLKFVPLTFSVRPLVPTAASTGSSLRRTGTGRAGVIVKVRPVESMLIAAEGARDPDSGVETTT